MSQQPLFSGKNPWFTGGVGITVAAFAVAALTGFVFLPYLQPDLKLSGVWDAICSAAGVVRPRSEAQPIAPDFKVSPVVLNAVPLNNPPPESIGRGATLAQKCAICHGPTGVSRADSPNLGGQYASAIYKQLQDFKSGARVNAVMTPFALELSDQYMQDIAAYYAYLPKIPADHPSGAPAPPRIVLSGAPLRGIAPCGSCHGGLENKAGSPWLEGQPAAYIKAQLQGFATATRRNDISQQMRNIARAMTPTEIDGAAAYYAGKRPETQAAQ